MLPTGTRPPCIGSNKHISQVHGNLPQRSTRILAQALVASKRVPVQFYGQRVGYVSNAAGSTRQRAGSLQVSRLWYRSVQKKKKVSGFPEGKELRKI